MLSFLVLANLLTNCAAAVNFRRDTLTPSDSKVIEKCVLPGHFALTIDVAFKRVDELLDVLRDEKARATFFISANNFVSVASDKRASANLKSIYRDGHQVASIGWTHKSLLGMSTEEQKADMDKNGDAIAKVIGKKPRYMMLPFSESNRKLLTSLGEWGYKIVGINADAQDYKHKDPETELMMNKKEYRHAMVTKGELSTIVAVQEYMPHSVEWVKWLIKDARGRGYKLVSVAECLGKGPMYRSS